MVRSSKFLPWFMWGLTACFYFYQFLLRVATANLREPLALEFNLTASDFGIFAAFWLVSYASLQIPVGLALDRWGVRRVFIISALGCSLGAFLMAMTDSFAVLCVSRLIIGASSAASFIGTVKVASEWFDHKLLPILVGVISGIGVLGASFAGVPMILIQHSFGWRNFFLMIAMIGVALAGVFALFLRNKQVDSDGSEDSILQSVRKILLEPQVWRLGLVGFVLYTPVSVIADLWGPSFISAVYKYSHMEAAFASSFIFYGNAFGSFLAGWVFSKFSSNRLFFSSFILVGMLTLLAIVWGNLENFIALVSMLFLLGAVVGAENMVFPLAGRYVERKHQGLAASVVNFIVMIGPILLQPAIGFVMDAVWDGGVSNGIKVYSGVNYKYGLSLVLVALLLSFWLSRGLKGYPKGNI